MQFLLSVSMRFVRGLFDYFWLITLALLVISAIGWDQYLSTHAFSGQAANQHTIWDVLLFTITLAPIKAPIVYGADVPLLLNIGRVLLPFVFIGGMFKVAMLRSSIEKRATQWFARTFRQHSVVCGLSQAGFALVCELLQRGHWVVLIDQKGPPALLSRLQQCLEAMPRANRNHFALIEGDATSTDTLRRGGVKHAKDIYAVTEDDYVNLDIATAAKALNASHGEGKPGIQIHVHFKDYLMRDPLKDDFKLFDSRALAGREIVNRYPADAPWLVTRDFSSAPHAMLIGMGSLGEQVVLQLARTAHYACGQRMCVTVVDSKAGDASKSFLQNFPMLAPHATPALFGMPADQGNYMSLPILDLHFVHLSVDAFCHEGFVTACAQHGIPGAIYICLGNDIETDRIAKALAIAMERALFSLGAGPKGWPRCTIVKSMRRLTQLTQSQKEIESKPNAELVSVIEVDVLRTAAAGVVSSDLERLAERAHTEYIEFSKKRDITTADVRPWSTLDDEAHQMNINTTDHHLVRLREMGINVSATDLRDGRLPVNSNAIELAQKYLADSQESFAAAEHRRWAWDKLFFGWRYGASSNKAAKLNSYLVGYETLAEDIKQYDRDNVERAFLLFDSP